jgi:chromosome partitioning protein
MVPRLQATGVADIQSSMKTMVLASAKGGVGKTLLTCALAVEAGRAGVGPVALLDTDEQGATARWAGKRAEAGRNGPTLIPGRAGPLRPVLAALEAEGFGLVVIDTPPVATAAILRAIQAADLVVVPVQPSPDDVESVGATIELVERAGRRMVFVVNRVKPRVALTGEAIIALSQGGPVAPVQIWDRVAHVEARITGRTAWELQPTSKAAVEMTALWNYLAQRLLKGRAYEQDAEIPGADEE